MANIVITAPQDQQNWNLDVYGTNTQVWFNQNEATTYLRMRIYLNGDVVHETPTGSYPTGSYYLLATNPGFTLQPLTEYTMYVAGGTFDGGWVWDAGPTITFTAIQPSQSPSKATTPAPTNANTGVTLDQANLTWVDGGGADTFDVYYGIESGNLSLVSSAQVDASFTVTGIPNGSPYDHLITRYWRIDSVNGNGTTTGDEWSFTTIRSLPPTETEMEIVDDVRTFFRRLIQSDGTYGDSPNEGGSENVDYVIVSALPNALATTRKIVAAANNKIWIEDL
jgi:hypothetical protein